MHDFTRNWTWRSRTITRTHHHAVSRCTWARLHLGLHALVHDFTRNLNLILACITLRAFSKCLWANLNSRAVKYMHANTSITLRACKVLTGSSCQAFHSQNPRSSRKVQVTLLLFFCHVFKCPKVIESDIPWRTLLVAYLFRCAWREGDMPNFDADFFVPMDSLGDA